VDIHNCKIRIECNLFWGAKPATGRYWYSVWQHNGGHQAIGAPRKSLERVTLGGEE